MNKLTAEVALRHQRDLKSFQENPNIGLSLKEELYLQALEIALPILEQQERGDGWIEWRGNSQPVNPSEIVKVRWDDGDMDTGPCRHFHWGRNCGNPIIAYRIIPEQPTNQNGEQ